MQEPMTLTIIECCGNCQYGNVLLRNLGDNFRDNLFYPRIIPQHMGDCMDVAGFLKTTKKA